MVSVYLCWVIVIVSKFYTFVSCKNVVFVKYINSVMLVYTLFLKLKIVNFHPLSESTFVAPVSLFWTWLFLSLTYLIDIYLWTK